MGFMGGSAINQGFNFLLGEPLALTLSDELAPALMPAQALGRCPGEHLLSGGVIYLSVAAERIDDEIISL
jgi:hypothetical protein